MVTIVLGGKAENADQFLLARAAALEAYAGLEQSLNSILALLLGTDDRSAGVIFFQIVNTRSRNRIIQDLLENRYGETYSKFWHGIPGTPNRRGLMNIISDLDSRRNEIVHWHAINTVNTDDAADGVARATMMLAPPTFWHKMSKSRLTDEDLVAFVTKARFAQRILTLFWAFNSPLTEQAEYGQEMRDAWRDIFQQPCVYPPPDNHPLSEKHTGR